MRPRPKRFRKRESAGILEQEQSKRDRLLAADLDATIDDGVRRIRAAQAGFDNGVIHGAYGKQSIVQTIYGVYRDLAADRLAAAIFRRLRTRLQIDADENFDPLDGLITLALLDLQEPVVANWADAIRLAIDSHVRSHKVRGFLYIKGGINRAARLYRQGKSRVSPQHDWIEGEDESFRRPSRKPRWFAPVGMNTLD